MVALLDTCEMSVCAVDGVEGRHTLIDVGEVCAESRDRFQDSCTV